MSQFPSNDAKNLMCKILSCKFYYSQAHKSLWRPWLINIPSRSITQGIGLVFEFLTRIKMRNKKILNKCKKNKNIVEKVNKIKKAEKKRKTQELVGLSIRTVESLT